MPNKSTAAQWFTTNVIFPKFSSMASSKKLDISRINEAISSSVFGNQHSREKCQHCFSYLYSRSRPTQCSKCLKWLHKIACYRDHFCNDQLSLGAPGNEATAELLSLSQSYDSIIEHESSSRYEPAQILSEPSGEPLVEENLVQGIVYDNNIGSRQALVSLPTLEIPQRPLNPNAEQFHPQLSTSQNNPAPVGRKTKKNNVTSSFTPQQAEIEALKIEISYAKTRVTVTVTDKNNSLKIYKEKVKILESARIENMNSEYLSAQIMTPTVKQC